MALRLNSRAPPTSDPMPATRSNQDHPEVPSVAIIKAEMLWVVLALVTMFLWTVSIAVAVIITWKIALFVEKIAALEDVVFINGQCIERVEEGE